MRQVNGASEFGTLPISEDVNSPEFFSIGQIEPAVQEFIRGYRQCVRGTNRDINLVVGTSNSGSDVAIRAGHGGAWGQMISRLRDWNFNSGQGLPLQVRVLGGSDIELDPVSFWDPTTTLLWVFDYHLNAGATLVDFGTCDDCQSTPQGNWTRDNIVDKSWLDGVAGVPMPEIYNQSTNPVQWSGMSSYARNKLNSPTPMRFLAVLTQFAAVRDNGGNPNSTNKPLQGWTALQTALDASTATAYYVRMGSDITYTDQPCLPTTLNCQLSE
jgi:hypothetical protein